MNSHIIRLFALPILGFTLTLPACADPESPEGAAFGEADDLDDEGADADTLADEEAEEADLLPDDGAEEADATLIAQQAPAANGGHTPILRTRLQNGTGPCAYRSGSVLATQNCSTSSAQVFDVYAPTSNRYNLCTTAAPVLDVIYENCSSFSGFCMVYPAWVAQCVYQYDANKIRIGKVALSVDRGAGFKPEPGLLTYEAGNIIGIATSGRKLTKNSSNVVVPGNYSGHPNQVWNLL